MRAHRAGIAGAVMVLVACGSSDDATIVVDGAPILVVPEGVFHEAAIRVEPAPQSLVSAADLSLVSSVGAAAYFDALEIRGAPGALMLALQPRCDVVAPGAGAGIVDLEVAPAEPGRFTSVSLTVHIPESRTTPCAPRARAWAGDCAAVPDGAGPLVDVPSGATQLCIAVENRDPTNERIWVRSQTNAPAELIAPGTLPYADDASTVSTVVIPLLDTDDIRGQFDIDVQIYRGDPTGGAALDTAERIQFRLGDPGTSIETVSQPSSIPEFNSGATELRVWHRDDAKPSATTCARVVHTTATPGVAARRGRATVRLYEGLDNSADADEWLCGASFRMAFSPPVDAGATETVRVDGAVCNCDTSPVSPTTTVVSRDVTLSIESRAEAVTCDDAFDVGDSIEVACADLDDDGDDTADLVVRTKDRLCVYGGDSGRLTELSAMTVLPADGAHTLHEFTRSNNGTERVILAAERVSGPDHRIVHLVMPTMSGQSPTWEAFAPASSVIRAMTHLAPIAPVANAPATYIGFIVPTMSGRGVRLLCVDEANCCPGGVCNSLDIDIVGFGAQESVAGLLPADVDGDGLDELIFFTFDDATGTQRLHARVIPIGWSGGAPVPGTGPYTKIGGITASGSRLRAAAIRSEACMTTNCVESVYAASVGGIGDAFVYVLIGGATPTLATKATPGIVNDVVGTDSVLVAGLEFGLYTSPLATAQGVGGWKLQDPVIRELSDPGQIGAPLPGYGSSVSSCQSSGAVGSAAVAITYGQVRYTQLNIDVAAP